MATETNIPNYTDHLRARQEAANKAREGFVNRVGPTIHVQLQVRHIVAEGYVGARVMAFGYLANNDETFGVMVKLNAATLTAFTSMARVAKEMDGTYTVTLP